MPIQEQNIKILASQQMDDVPEGGGAATGLEIVDGAMNNVFPDVSDQDRAMGRFQLRKLFLAVRTLSTDRFGSARMVVTALPDDPAVGYTLFSTNDPFDVRDQAASRVEAYLFKAGMWPGALYEKHITGMRQIRVIQRVGSELPPIGKTLCLVQHEDQQGEVEQYVRVTDVSVSEQTFTHSYGQEYVRWIVTLSLSDALRHDFEGHEVNLKDDYDYNAGARLRDTTVADATRYHSAQRTAEPAGIGDRTIRVESIFSQLVPSAQAETPLVNQPLNPELSVTINAGTRSVEIPQQAQTLARQVTAANRRLNWIETLPVAPAPGSLSLSYMAQGNWYTLTDDGTGILAGSDPAFGTGTLDYVTKALSVTLGALPDAGSMILIIWGTEVLYQRLSGPDAINASRPEIRGTLNNLPVDVGSVSFEWPSGGATKTATADASGDISGDATGSVDGTTGEYSLQVANLPDRGAQLLVTSSKLEPQTSGDVVRGQDTLPVGLTLVLSQTPDLETLRLRLPLGSSSVIARARGGEIWTDTSRRVLEQKIGVISGNTITLDALSVRARYQYIGMVAQGGEVVWVDDKNQEYDASLNSSGAVVAEYTVAGAQTTPVSVTETLEIDTLIVPLAPTSADDAVPESIEFTLGGQVYQDRAGRAVTDIDPATGAALDAGTLDYGLSEATLSYWIDGQAAALSVTSMLTAYSSWTTTAGFFRTASAPLKPEALQITGTAVDGEQLIATANPDGDFVAEYIQGTADYTIGVAQVTFGKLVPDSSLTPEQKAEPWYDPANVDGDGNIYQPRPMLPSTLRYNAVAYRYIPLDADIVGIDAVRLPSDGRVPTYRSGDLVMIMHPQDEAPQTVATGDVVATRPRVAWVRVLDANGDAVVDGYSLDRATGNLTFNDVAGVAMPITVRHTVADLRLLTDAQINGYLELSRPLSHPFPASETIVASCLLFGDRRARVSATWDQETWNETWSDSPQGKEATATLNLIDHPITVTNEGCDTDRWVLRCTNAAADQWELISEKRGLVWSGSYAPGGDDVAPINPRTRGTDGQGGVPYMLIPGQANGGGWETGNVVRINTVGAIADFWVARSIQQSDVPVGDGEDGTELYAQGNINRP
ncbi:hypothetical protein [Marinobacter sp. CA1]|uniref:hypothetical protein n=1 Tax=Marinobacter sp. CA1 TaxID=2817656 RepID=UPI001D06343E|nr:hypothetical protein [Marinobacter sp. CA1]UDL03970.1 hypothetical protein J2887_14775 [Marinobacter sp. CA1]